jgi:predicted RNA-binding protein with PIN domain
MKYLSTELDESPASLPKRYSKNAFYGIFFEVVETVGRIEKKVEKRYPEHRNLLADRIGQDVLEKLEKIRRSR